MDFIKLFEPLTKSLTSFLTLIFFAQFFNTIDIVIIPATIVKQVYFSFAGFDLYSVYHTTPEFRLIIPVHDILIIFSIVLVLHHLCASIFVISTKGKSTK